MLSQRGMFCNTKKLASSVSSLSYLLSVFKSCSFLFCLSFDFLQLICTVTPASSSMEETHNTLKFASRAKRVEIYASRNKVCFLSCTTPSI